jgi:hypothetical protein
MIYVLRDNQIDGGAATIETIGMIEAYQSVIWAVQYYGQGELQLITQATPENINLLRPGNYLVRDVDYTADKCSNVMAIQDIDISYDSEAGNLITVIGKSLKNEILKRRVISWRAYLRGYAESQVRNIITLSFCTNSGDYANKKISNFVLDAAKGFTNVMDIQVLGNNLAEWLEEVSKTYGWGWDVYISNNQYHFTLYAGLDRTREQELRIPVIFSKEYDNLYHSEYKQYTQNYQNMAYIFGEDTADGKSRKNTYYNPLNMTGFNRRERYIDSSQSSTEGETTLTDTEYYNILKGLAKQELSQIRLYDFEANIDYQGIYKINEDFFLGDIVDVITEYGVEASSRIIEVIYAEDENGTSVVPTFSEWEVES